jgi:hypothetical protein
MKDGKLKIVNHDGKISITELVEGMSYFRSRGVNHNVFNYNDFPFSFVEIEFK